MKKMWVRFLSQEDSPGEGTGNPAQSSCLEKPMDRAGWRTIVHGAAKESEVTRRVNNHHITAPLVFCPSSLVPGSMPAWILPWSLYLALAGPPAVMLPMIQDCEKQDQRLDKEVLLSLFPQSWFWRLSCSRLPMSLPLLPPSDWDPTNLAPQRFLMAIC